MKKITIFFVFLTVLGYIISGFFWGFSGLGGIVGAIILYFATNNKESTLTKEMREAREEDFSSSTTPETAKEATLL